MGRLWNWCTGMWCVVCGGNNTWGGIWFGADVVLYHMCIQRMTHPTNTYFSHKHILHLKNTHTHTQPVRHFGKGPFDLPLETKLFLLRRDGTKEEDANPPRGAAPSFVPPEPLPV